MIYDILNFTFFSESELFNTRYGIIIYLQTVMRFNINIENVYKFVLYCLMVPTMYKLHVFLMFCRMWYKLKITNVIPELSLSSFTLVYRSTVLFIYTYSRTTY